MYQLYIHYFKVRGLYQWYESKSHDHSTAILGSPTPLSNQASSGIQIVYIAQGSFSTTITPTLSSGIIWNSFLEFTWSLLFLLSGGSFGIYFLQCLFIHFVIFHIVPIRAKWFHLIVQYWPCGSLLCNVLSNLQSPLRSLYFVV